MKLETRLPDGQGCGYLILFNHRTNFTGEGLNILHLNFNDCNIRGVKASVSKTANKFLLIVVCVILTGFATSNYAQGFVSTTFLSDISVNENTGEKPQSKIWTHNGSWFAVLPNSSGTHIWRLDGTTWSDILFISSDNNTHADCKVVGDVTHIFLYSGTSSELVSVEYLSGSNSYQLWSTRSTSVAITLDTGVETATIDIDANGRMWLASDATNAINVRWSDSPYSTWSSAITLASIFPDDICVVTAFDDDQGGTKIGVLWSNQQTDRYGFKYHVDGADPTTWSVDEVPAGQSAQNQGNGMADDHLNCAVASNGTIFAAVKTSYDTQGFPKIALLRRDPDGTWDDLYEVDESGTRGIAILNESLGKIRVIYTASEGNNNIVYKESSTSNISFGSQMTLISGSNNNVTSSKQNFTDEIVILASNGSTTKSVLATDLNDLAGRWKMDEGSGSTIDDASINGNDGSITGSPSWVPGIFDQALSLDGSSDYAVVPDDATLDLTDGMTLAAWIKPEATGTQQIINKVDGSSGFELFLSSNSPDYVNVQLNGSATYKINSTSMFPTDGTTWMHVAATYDGLDLKLFINGLQEGPTISGQGSINTNSADVGIGADDSGNEKFQGALDDVRIYNRALSNSEIQDLATAPNTNVLAGYWPLDTGSGSNIIDGSSYGNDGSILGSGTATWVQGIHNNAVRLDGFTYISVPDDASLDFTDGITMAAWIKPEEYRKQQIMRKKNGSTGYEITLSNNSNNTISVRLNGNNAYRIYSTSVYPINGDWMHIAATYDNSSTPVLKLYINAVEENSTTNVPASIGTNSDPLGIGADDDGDDKFKGTLDDVQIYNTALSQTQIEQLMNSPLPVELSLFTAYLQGSDIRLDWRTETEVNNYGFYILRLSARGGQDDEWVSIGFVDGYGNTNSPKEYSFIDKSPSGSTHFSYRLKQIDNDGSFEYSDIVEVEIVPSDFALYQNYPNPFNSTTRIKYTVAPPNLPEGEAYVIIKVYDVLGNEIATLVNEEKTAGTYEIEFNASSLASGMYVYRMQAGNFVLIKKMMILK